MASSGGTHDDTDSDESMEVADFLRQRNVLEDVVKTFVNNKMDTAACLKASDDELHKLGLVHRGDIIHLKGFCLLRDKNTSDNKENLKSTLQAASADRITKSKKKKPNRLTNKTVYLGWKNFNQNEKRLINVRSSNGGGLRTVSLDHNTNYESLFKLMKDLFFPNEKSKYGKVNEMILVINDAQGQPIDPQNFHLGNYVKVTKFSKTKFVLVSSKMSSQQFVMQHYPVPDDDKDLSDFEVQPPSLQNTINTMDKPFVFVQTSPLIGNSLERANVINNQDTQYQESLLIDQAKETESKEKTEAESIHAARVARLLPTPDLNEDHIVISVRHLQKGIVRRLFSPNFTISCVYDWIGSLSLLPMYFGLSDRNNNVIQPDKPINTITHVLNMFQMENGLPFEPDNEIRVIGFANRTLDVSSSSIFDIADEETDRFFLRQEVTTENDQACIPLCECNEVEEIKKLRDNYGESVSQKNMLCHRHPEKFWSVIFRQKFAHDKFIANVIWAGEPGSDGGGLYREFLLYSMENFAASQLLFGKSNLLFLTTSPSSVVSKEYHTLGQLSALAIIHIGRGPHCLHPSLTNQLFDLPLGNIVKSTLDGEAKFNVEKIESGDNSPLIEAGINPQGNELTNSELYLKNHLLISKCASIDQFAKGVTSISSYILKNSCCFYKYFVYSKPNVKLTEVRSNLQYIRSENGSNQFLQEEEAITEVELFLMELDKNKENKSLPSLSDFLKFVAAVDRIPVGGLGKMIEVFFVKESRLPTASTCGLFLTLSINVNVQTLMRAVLEGGTFGMA